MQWQLRSPNNTQELEDYFKLRWEILRQPWKQPRGSERDDLEYQAYHLMIILQSGKIIAVGRAHKTLGNEVQIRYMAVHENYRGKKFGHLMLQGLEKQASTWRADQIVLNARKSVIGFYEKHGYQTCFVTETLFDSIEHVRMKKILNYD